MALLGDPFFRIWRPIFPKGPSDRNSGPARALSEFLEGAERLKASGPPCAWRQAVAWEQRILSCSSSTPRWQCEKTDLCRLGRTGTRRLQNWRHLVGQPRSMGRLWRQVPPGREGRVRSSTTSWSRKAWRFWCLISVVLILRQQHSTCQGN